MKTSEMREAGIEELKKKVGELRRQLLTARICKVTQQLKNPLKVRFLRREIARALTIISEKGKGEK